MGVVVFEVALGRTRRKRRVEFMASEVIIMNIMCFPLLRRWNQFKLRLKFRCAAGIICGGLIPEASTHVGEPNKAKDASRFEARCCDNAPRCGLAGRTPSRLCHIFDAELRTAY